jgi:energy-coupling factor transporter ATP-binding protein EcfA2
MHAPPKFRRGEQLRTLLRIAAVCTLFRSHRGQPYASVPHSAFAANAYPLDSLDFRNWLAQRFHSETDTPPTSYALRGALQALEAQAQFGPLGETAAGPRLIPGNGTILLDLADSESHHVEISKQGWEPKDGVIFAFQRGAHTGELPPPTAPEQGCLTRLRRLLNIPAGENWTRTLVWLTAAMRPEGPYPILVLRGPSGSGKSTTARMLRSLLDPMRSAHETIPATPRLLERSAQGRRILVFDDVHRIPRAVVSTLAKVADETAPVILSLSSLGKGELLENIARRSLIVDLAEPQQLRTLFALRRAFDALQPQVLGALCTAASHALAGFDQYAEEIYSRLPDATAWALAAAPALQLAKSEIRAAILAPIPVGEPLLPERRISSTTAADRAPEFPATAIPSSASGPIPVPRIICGKGP